MVLFPLKDFDAMRESAAKLKEETKEEKNRFYLIRRQFEMAAVQLEIFLSHHKAIDPKGFAKSVQEFNSQSEEAEIIIRPDGKVKIKILQEKISEKEESSDS